MSLPDIDLFEIRQHHGSQANAFEELCCQIANEELIKDKVRFDRKGRGGDAGVECFATLKDGAEIGWQVKFYTNFKSMIGSLDLSLTTALAKHPKMNRFIACFPFDLSDSRKDNVKTSLSEWDKWKNERITCSKALGRTITIDRWDAHEIKLRLTESNIRSAGRVAFWFDKTMLNAEWLGKAFDRVADSLGDRYSPESHIDLPVRKTILATLRDPAIFDELLVYAEKIEDRLKSVTAHDIGGASSVALAAVAMLRQEGILQSEPFPLAVLRDTVDKAAELAFKWHNTLDLKRSSKSKPDPEIIALSNLVSALRIAALALRSERWQHIDTRALLIVGEAGTGKSHLLADACAHQLQLNRPALMVLGGKLPDAEPWGEILRDLDLPRHLQVKHFLGALNAAGESAGVRSLIAIDALNEKNGQSIWPTRLPGLLKDLRDFPWITVVLSCRSIYANVIIPSSIDETLLPRIEHKGFNDKEVVRYLSRHGISIPETPHQLDELQNPLFLRLVCDLFRGDGEVLLPESLVSISDVLGLYTAAVSRRVETNLGVAPTRKVVRKAITALVEEMANTGRGQIGYERADELLRLIHNGQEMAHDLLFQLANEGLLAIEPDSYSVSGDSEVIRFEFERVGDHAISANLLDRSAQNGIANICETGSPLNSALSDRNSLIRAGLLEAVAVQLPERFNIELLELPLASTLVWSYEAFTKSLLTRRVSAFTERTWTLVENTKDGYLRYETLIALASEPKHPFNVNYLTVQLRSLNLPKRDASWTIHLAHSERADHLVDWAWNAEQSQITEERAELAAIQLAWFLTATRRPLRDRATKALVALIADRPGLAITLWDNFKDIDDDYVTERVVASLYGAAMQGRWEAHQLTKVATRLFRDLFAENVPPVNELLRDHALGLIGYAQFQGEPSNSIDPDKLKRPFKSPWPIEYVTDETIDSYTRNYNSNYRGRDEIVNSCLDGDFGRYVLDYAVQDWSPAPFGTVDLPTAYDLREEWFEQFKSVATQEMMEAYETLLATMVRENPENRSITGESRVRIDEAKAQFRTIVGADAFEEWRAKAEHWRSEGMYQRLARQGAAEFNLAWARRWVVMRAHELGWSEELHGNFDRSIRSNRNEHSLERIGKKYQWLALYELVARMRDNLAILPNKENDVYGLRNLDPSLLVSHTSDNGWKEFAGRSFWTGNAPTLPARTPDAAIVWLHSDEDILDGNDVIEVVSPEDAHEWLVLTGFETWSARAEGFRTESWRRVACLVVNTVDLSKAINIMSGCHLTTNHDLPTAMGGGSHVHLGEFPWRTLSQNYNDWIDQWYPYGVSKQTGDKISVLPTTVEYSAESVGYDGSINDNINIFLPASWIMEGLNLRLKDGRSIFYQDDSHQVIFWDPSVSRQGRSAALVDRNLFLNVLKNKGYSAIWAVAGEKNAYGEEFSSGFGGRFTFTRLYYSDGAEIKEATRFDTYDEPDQKQLAKFRECQPKTI
ncbi:ATP-binding protein [Enterobacter hormaechei]|uniref:ATP-binding protein n=1 Tax=Enterobacter hormaechei TaxID=158836 RepID=UPI002550D917|nr:ATP-binding protein [Enterobacter hormaechei]MDL0036925.1 ATP-binding protein [Enterobacter hormaechei]